MGSNLRHTDIAIIGGGVQGLALAYHLAKRGRTDTVLLERSYLNAGASGRCGGGVRQQWSNADNIEIMVESVRQYENFSRETGSNIWFRQGGYLFLAQDDDEATTLHHSAKLQRSLGLPTEILSRHRIKQLVPDINSDRFVCGAYNPKDGIVFPWPVLWAYAEVAQGRGVQIDQFTEVTAIMPERERFRIATTRGEITANHLFVCAGAWTRELLIPLGIHLETRPIRHEILVTEPLKAFLNPMVVLMKNGLYLGQSMRGEVVSGITLDDAVETYRFDVTPIFLQTIARELIRAMPLFASIKVLRVWSGCYDVTPDASPILGAVDGIPNLYVACGFMGYGFMMAPAIGKYMAEWFLHGRHRELIAKYHHNRFQTGVCVKEKFLVG